jgi:hypothetical protein
LGREAHNIDAVKHALRSYQHLENSVYEEYQNDMAASESAKKLIPKQFSFSIFTYGVIVGNVYIRSEYKGLDL